MMCGLSSLDEKKIGAIKTTEQKMGKTLLAYSCLDIAPAELTKEELAQLNEIEQKLGILLVAVKS